MTDDDKTEFMIQLLTSKKKGGRLTKWGKHAWRTNSYIGVISESDGWFNDGDVVTTSRAVKIYTFKGQKILETANSYYYLDEEGTPKQLESHYNYEGYDHNG